MNRGGGKKIGEGGEHVCGGGVGWGEFSVDIYTYMHVHTHTHTHTHTICNIHTHTRTRTYMHSEYTCQIYHAHIHSV